MRILHLLSQKPEATGSGITIRAMMANAHRKGNENFIVAGVPEGEIPSMPAYMGENSDYVFFRSEKLPFEVIGMSDVMPYPSKRFSSLTQEELLVYENCFKEKVERAVETFKPHIIHSHHLWLLTSLVKRTFPTIPVVGHCHGTALRQFQLCPSLRERVLSGCSLLDAAMVLSVAQKKEVMKLYSLPEEKVHIINTGYDEKVFYEEGEKKSSRVEIAYGGKLSRAKGVLWMLKSLDKIKDVPWHLHLAGSGSGHHPAEKDRGDCSKG